MPLELRHVAENDGLVLHVERRRVSGSIVLHVLSVSGSEAQFRKNANLFHHTRSNPDAAALGWHYPPERLQCTLSGAQHIQHYTRAGYFAYNSQLLIIGCSAPSQLGRNIAIKPSSSSLSSTNLHYTMLSIVVTGIFVENLEVIAQIASPKGPDPV